MRFIRTVFIYPVLITALVSAGCSDDGTVAGASGERGGGPPAVPVTTASVVQKPMPIEIQVIGSAEPYSTVGIRSQITGQLLKVNFREGDIVQRGQILFELDKRPLEAALEQAQANLQRDMAQAANAEVQATRLQQLVDRGMAPRDQGDTAKTSVVAMNATVEADRAAVENAKIQLQYATIPAPLTGRTGALMVHQGNLVRANDQIPLVTINEVAPISVAFAIPEARLADLRRYMSGGSLTVTATPQGSDQVSTGRITFIDNAVDQNTGTIRIKGTFPNQDGRLWPGQFVNVVVTLTTDPKAIVVPSVAVQAGQQGTYVFAVKPDQTVELRPVTVARVRGAESVIAIGVQPGEMVSLSERGIETRQIVDAERRSFCVFEHIYFARPDSLLEGNRTQVSRRKMGEILWREAPADADVVIAVPDSGNAAAAGYSKASGIPRDDGLIKNRYVARTFIQPGQELRKHGLRMKFNPLPEIVAGKRIVVVDDSIVRGNTTRQIIGMLREAGAKEIHLRISAPPIRHPCHYGIDMSTRE